MLDALSSPRTYKAPIPREKCLAMMAEDRGTHFEARVLGAFYARSKEADQVPMECMDR